MTNYEASHRNRANFEFDRICAKEDINMKHGPLIYRPLDILWPHLQAPRNRAALQMLQRTKNRGWGIKGKALPVESYQTLAKVVRNPQNAWYRPMQEGLW